MKWISIRNKEPETEREIWICVPQLIFRVCSLLVHILYEAYATYYIDIRIQRKHVIFRWVDFFLVLWSSTLVCYFVFISYWKTNVAVIYVYVVYVFSRVILSLWDVYFHCAIRLINSFTCSKFRRRKWICNRQNAKKILPKKVFNRFS